MCQTESDAKVRTMKSTVRVFSLVIRGPPVDLLWGMLVNARAGAPFLRTRSLRTYLCVPWHTHFPTLPITIRLPNR